MRVMVVMTMMTGLGRQHNTCKHRQRYDGEHKIANLHGESPQGRL
jgi:hypothetical protein